MNAKQLNMNAKQLNEIIEAMPDGMDGFCKTWGFQQFANAVEHTVRNELQGELAKQVVPEGWKLVPIEPTEEMRDAAGEALYGHSREQAAEWAKTDKFESYAEDGESAYEAMLNAAPTYKGKKRRARTGRRV